MIEETDQLQDQAPAALALLLRMARVYLAEAGSTRNLEMRSRIVVNGILAALGRSDLRLSVLKLQE